MRPAGLGPSAGQPFAAKRLTFDHRANLVAVDVDVADPGAGFDQVEDERLRGQIRLFAKTFIAPPLAASPQLWKMAS